MGTKPLAGNYNTIAFASRHEPCHAEHVRAHALIQRSPSHVRDSSRHATRSLPCHDSGLIPIWSLRVRAFFAAQKPLGFRSRSRRDAFVNYSSILQTLVAFVQKRYGFRPVPAGVVFVTSVLRPRFLAVSVPS